MGQGRLGPALPVPIEKSDKLISKTGPNSGGGGEGIVHRAKDWLKDNMTRLAGGGGFLHCLKRLRWLHMVRLNNADKASLVIANNVDFYWIC